MIGNGGHAGEELDNPGRVAQRRQALENGFVDGANEYRARREQGAVRDVRAVEPAEGRRLRAIAPCTSRP